MSFPVVFALEHTSGAKREELVTIYKAGQMDEKTVRRVLDIFDSIDTQANAQKLVEDYSQKAKQAFNRLDISVMRQKEMAELVEFLTGRTF